MSGIKGCQHNYVNCSFCVDTRSSEGYISKHVIIESITFYIINKYMDGPGCATIK